MTHAQRTPATGPSLSYEETCVRFVEHVRLPTLSAWETVVEANAESLLEGIARPTWTDAFYFVSDSSWIIDTAYHVPCLVFGGTRAPLAKYRDHIADVDTLTLPVWAQAALGAAVYERISAILEASQREDT